MMRTLAFLICLCLLAPAALAKPGVTAARFGEHPDKTRFVIELTEVSAYRVFTLPDPFRVVIDLPEFDWLVPPARKPKTAGVVTDLRHGLFTPGISRIVLDVNAPVRVKSIHIIPPGAGVSANRLAIDLEPISRQRFFAEDARRPIESAIPLQAKRSPNQAAPPVDRKDARPLIIVDAGHGGVDPGARGISGILEKTLVLQYARELKRQLVATGRYRVLMTRERDVVLPLRDRVKIAQEAEGDLFVSLHANTNSNSKIRGASIYTISTKGASDAEAEALAAKENEADVIAGINFGTHNEDVREILFDLVQRETINLSKNFANLLVSELDKSIYLLGNTHRFAGFVVLKSPAVPSVLVELGHLSNPQEEKKLRSKSYRQKLVKSVVTAIDRYFTWHEQMSRS